MGEQMGLITYFINTIAVGASCVACSPFDFIRRPSIWMQLMSKYKVTTRVLTDMRGYSSGA
jgi:hypothetical protein